MKQLPCTKPYVLGEYLTTIITMINKLTYLMSITVSILRQLTRYVFLGQPRLTSGIQIIRCGQVTIVYTQRYISVLKQRLCFVTNTHICQTFQLHYCLFILFIVRFIALFLVCVLLFQRLKRTINNDNVFIVVSYICIIFHQHN